MREGRAVAAAGNKMMDEYCWRCYRACPQRVPINADSLVISHSAITSLHFTYSNLLTSRVLLSSSTASLCYMPHSHN